MANELPPPPPIEDPNMKRYMALLYDLFVQAQRDIDTVEARVTALGG